jgi:hypothetical protein
LNFGSLKPARLHFKEPVIQRRRVFTTRGDTPRWRSSMMRSL